MQFLKHTNKQYQGSLIKHGLNLYKYLEGYIIYLHVVLHQARFVFLAYLEIN